MYKIRSSFFSLLLLSVGLLLVLHACSTGSPERDSKPELKEYVFVVNIVPDSLKLKEYLDYHAHIWPEVEAGFRKAGYRKITLYRHGYLLVMTLSVPADANLDQMGKTAESYDKRCAEWNRLMDGYQTGVAGTGKNEKWVEAAPFYRFVKD